LKTAKAEEIWDRNTGTSFGLFPQNRETRQSSRTCRSLHLPDVTNPLSILEMILLIYYLSIHTNTHTHTNPKLDLIGWNEGKEARGRWVIFIEIKTKKKGKMKEMCQGCTISYLYRS
jgi:hypothetical protein